MATFSDQGSSTDTFIRNSQATTNFGTQAVFDDGESNSGAQINRELIKWDLSSIPVNSLVDSATLSVYVQSDDAANTRTMQAYRVLRVWTLLGATWNKFDGSVDWGTAGCSNTSTDREASGIGSVSIPSSNSAGTEFQISLTPSDVQQWISGAFANNGVLLQMDTENNDGHRYESSRSATSGIKPKLVINYHLPVTAKGYSYII
jgi:hypothetical protein